MSADCPACQATTGSSIHRPVPVATQFLSPELIPAILYAGRDPGLDPRWSESGAADRPEYAYWANRACGMACLQMILAHYRTAVPALVELARDALTAGCYVRRPDGGLDGLLYRPFVEFVTRRFGLRAAVETGLDRDRLFDLISAGSLVMASVHPEIRRPERPAPGRGGHLVLIVGTDGDRLHLRNPSGHDDRARSAVLTWSEFEPFFAGRGVAVRPPA